MLTDKEQKNLSKFLSFILRHHPEVIDIKLDKNGWADIDELISKINKHGKNIDKDKLHFIVENNNKKRFAISEDNLKIRASQGHSINIELGYKPETPPDILYHGTGEKYIESILKKGLIKKQRHHVHMSADKETAFKVGQRHGKPVILIINAKEMFNDGHQFFISENSVWLTDNVPVEYIEKL